MHTSSVIGSSAIFTANRGAFGTCTHSITNYQSLGTGTAMEPE
jgi:hypothetical protein